MKVKFLLVLLVLIMPIIVFAQKAAPEAAVEPDAVSTGGNVKDNASKKVNTTLPDGYGDLQWGNDFQKVKDGAKGKIIFSEENSVIVSKDNEIKYRYGFFYIDPVKIGEVTAEVASEKEADLKLGRFFYCAIEFPYIAMKDILAKFKEKYGDPTGENISKNRGAIVWESEKTVIVVWIDEYEKKSYCRRITYYSKDISKDLKSYKNKIFNKTEIDVLKKLVP